MIQIKDTSFAYTSKRNIFSQLNLELNAGSIVGLLGRNGEGKSTLMKLITGQLIAKQGHISCLGIDTSLRTTSLLQRIYMLPEEVNVPRITIREYFDIVSGFYPSYSESIANDIIREFEIDWSWNLGKISLGQRKKALITLALALRTPILLLDEPTNGLDIPSKSVFRRLLAKYSGDEQLIIISTHQVRDLEQLIDHIVMLDNNKVVCNHSIATLSERLQFGLVGKHNESTPLYKEEALMGEYGVWALDEGEEPMGDFSMELFFNAMISNKAAMQSIINK